MFEKYHLYKTDNKGRLVVNGDGLRLQHEAFELFKEQFNHDFGKIEQHGNLTEIHTGGWSDNEALINDFKKTYWWTNNHQITQRGGHYYFCQGYNFEKCWSVERKGFNEPV